jgi:organic radical activating enzyme
MLRLILREIINATTHWLHFKVRYRIPWGPYKNISKSDKHSFNQVLSAWRPADDLPVFLLRWSITKLCNYRCPYCPQSHTHSAPYDKFTPHAFDNHSLRKWLEAFSHHFKERRLSLVITGGEPMIDRINMVTLLQKLAVLPTVECIRIDTNVSWDPSILTEIDYSKIILFCSYHPSQVSEESFLDHIDHLLSLRVKIGLVNMVMVKDSFEIYNKMTKRFTEKGIPLHPSPEWDTAGQYSSNEMKLFKRELPDADYSYRTKTLSPYKKSCLFPALAYEMDQYGRIQVGCHGKVSGTFFDYTLPVNFAGPVPCPARFCACLDKYSFLKEVNRNTSVNPLQIYSNLLLKIRKAELK